MKIAIGNDHVAVAMKYEILRYLRDKGHIVTDYGTDSENMCDYPVYGRLVAKSVSIGDNDCGILICGTGIGISLTANKIKGIRAAVCSEPYSAMMAKKHNDANVIAFGARVIGIEMAKMIVDSWLDTSFEGGIHKQRVDMMMQGEQEHASVIYV